MPLFGRSKKGPAEPGLTLFFATDLHGSDVCFRKFLNARAVYEADVLIMGGDMTGKLAVPIMQEARGRYRVHTPGRSQEVEGSDLEDIERALRKSGFYPFVCTPEEAERYRQDPSLVEPKFDQLMRERLRQWAEWADQKFAGTDAEILIAPGNDDPFAIDEVLPELPRFRLVEGEVIRLAPDHPFEMLSTGYSNRTPWDTHRELDEDDLRERLEKIVPRVQDLQTAIFNIHVPPHGSQLDNGPIIDRETMKAKAGFGTDVSVPVGSHACRAFIEAHQPMLSLHGHIHESRGVIHLGRTTAINPGSDYGDGILRGALVRISDRGDVLNYQLTSG